MTNDTPRDPDETPPEGSRRSASDPPPDRPARDPETRPTAERGRTHREETTLREGRAEPTPGALKRISWGAVFAGAILAVVVQVALGLLGLGIGFTAIDITDPDEAFAIGAGIWWLITGILALFVGGLAAGRLAGVPTTRDSALHGLIAWGVVTLLMLFMMTTAVGQVMGVAFGVVGQGVTALADDTAIQEQTMREMAVDVLARYGDLTRQEAEQRVQDFEQEMEAADERAERIAETTGIAAIWGFVAMFFGALAGAAGGALATPRDLPASMRLHRE